MDDPPSPASQPNGEIIFYRSEDGQIRVECRLVEGALWLTQKLIAELFQVSVPTVNEHLKTIYSDKELSPETTIRKFRIVQIEGNRQVERLVDHYRLEAIIAVGYRVRSIRGVQFRQWATTRLEEYLRKGFTLDDERLKNPPSHGVVDYFDELLERIRDIRASERRVYLQLRNILALAADYDPTDTETQRFFQITQNKLHFAVTGKTAPELIAERANAELPNMGLTNWKGNWVRKVDVTIAKNYLKDKEITELNRIVVMFLDYAEDQANRRKQIFLQDWKEKLDQFLKFNDRSVLTDNGRISREDACHKAHEQYGIFTLKRREDAETIGEHDAIAQLMDSAKKLPARRKREK